VKRFFPILVLLGTLFGCSADGLSGAHSSGIAATEDVSLGMAITPKNFPAHEMADMDEAFLLARHLAEYSVLIHQWGHLDLRVARMMTEKSRQAGLHPILGLSPTTLDQARKELDLPTEVRRMAGNRISFANPVIRKAYIDTVKQLAHLRPAYLCLATEINFLALQRLKEYLRFATLYKEAYRAAKRISPSTKVFVSFQWEWMRIVDAKEPHKIKEHSKVIDIFRPELDVIGLTSYPSPFHASPAELPHDYYSWLNHHIRENDEVLVMELGWPTQGSGSELEQQEFIGRLPDFFRHVNVSVIAWALLHDVTLDVFDANLNSVGLINNSGQKKRGFYEFKALKHSFR
jgi:hypothetical protein